MSSSSQTDLDLSLTPKVYKNRTLNNANFQDFTLTDYQIFLTLISKIGFVDSQGRYLQPEEISKQYTLSAKEFSKLFNIPLQHSYGYLKKAMDKLLKTEIRIENIEGKKGYRRINVCAGADYLENEGKVVIHFTHLILPYLTQVKQKFMLYNLKEIADFKSLNTTRLYELILEFKDTGLLIIKVDKFKEALAISDKYKMFAHLKASVVVPSMREINKIYPTINLKFEEIRPRKAVEALCFKFNKVNITEIHNPLTGESRLHFNKHPKVKN